MTISVNTNKSALTALQNLNKTNDELASTHPGRRMAGFSRVDSRDDARVQVADLVAGVVRRALEDQLSGGRNTPPVPVSHLVAEDSLVLSPLPGVHRSSR